MASPSPHRCLCFPPAVAGDSLAPSRSPYWPGVPVTLLLWVLTAESSKLVPFYETRLTGADRAATANTDGYETLTLFVKEGTIVWWRLWSRAFPLYQAKAVQDSSHISFLGSFFSSIPICSLPHKLFLTSTPSEESHACHPNPCPKLSFLGDPNWGSCIIKPLCLEVLE